MCRFVLLLGNPNDRSKFDMSIGFVARDLCICSDLSQNNSSCLLDRRNLRGYATYYYFSQTLILRSMSGNHAIATRAFYSSSPPRPIKSKPPCLLLLVIDPFKSNLKQETNASRTPMFCPLADLPRTNFGKVLVSGLVDPMEKLEIVLLVNAHRCAKITVENRGLEEPSS